MLLLSTGLLAFRDHDLQRCLAVAPAGEAQVLCRGNAALVGLAGASAGLGIWQALGVVVTNLVYNAHYGEGGIFGSTRLRLQPLFGPGTIGLGIAASF